MIPEKILFQLCRLFAIFPEIKEVFLYGSRAKDQASSHSDIDLAVFAPNLNASDFARLQYKITYEMPTFIPIEIVHLKYTATDFSEQIKKKGKIIYERG